MSWIPWRKRDIEPAIDSILIMRKWRLVTFIVSKNNFRVENNWTVNNDSLKVIDIFSIMLATSVFFFLSVCSFFGFHLIFCQINEKINIWFPFVYGLSDKKNKWNYQLP